jgi:hypothetical protein
VWRFRAATVIKLRRPDCDEQPGQFLEERGEPIHDAVAIVEADTGTQMERKAG